jgi:hypothetical protein
LNQPKLGPRNSSTSNSDQFIAQIIPAQLDYEALEVVKAMSSELGSDAGYCSRADVRVFDCKGRNEIPYMIVSPNVV